EIKLPDGNGTWAAAWVRDGNELWVLQKGTVRSYDFTNPAEVKETAFEGLTRFDKVPKPIVDALRAALDVPGAPVQQQKALEPKDPKPQPKDKEARALFQFWKENARKDGNIPGGLVGRLGDKVK